VYLINNNIIAIYYNILILYSSYIIAPLDDESSIVGTSFEYYNI